MDGRVMPPIRGRAPVVAGARCDAIQRIPVPHAGVMIDAGGTDTTGVPPDKRFVTDLDLSIEMRLRETLAAEYPCHGILGGEFAASRPTAKHVCAPHPIDGTAPFVACIPVCATLIAPGRPATLRGRLRRGSGDHGPVARRDRRVAHPAAGREGRRRSDAAAKDRGPRAEQNRRACGRRTRATPARSTSTVSTNRPRGAPASWLHGPSADACLRRTARGDALPAPAIAASSVAPLRRMRDDVQGRPIRRNGMKDHMHDLSFLGRSLVAGSASGPVLHADLGLSFWGGIAAETGVVIDAQHPLHGRCVAGSVLVIPSGRGSCTGSAVLLELIMNGAAPAAIVFREDETILPLGALVADALFGRSLPMVRLARGAFAALATARHATVADGRVTAAGASPSAAALDLPPCPDVAPDLTDRDRAMLDGAEGPARQLAMRIVLQMARLEGAQRLIDLSQCHLDCCIYTGPVSVAIAERMRDLGARVRVPTTLNAISIDRGQWRALGIPPDRAAEVERQTDAYLAMGAAPSFTCAPYLLDSAPAPGEHVGWAESNAVAFANSVLGARTGKYPDYLDLCMALTGRAPLSGCHLDANRRAHRHIHVDLPVGADDSLFPLLGYLAGKLSPHDIPALTGLEGASPSRDDLKAFAAAFATTSAAPMFHIVGITPEAPDLATALGGGTAAEAPRIGGAELLAAWWELNGVESAPVACIAIGNPHASFEELAAIATLTEGRAKAAATQAIITTSRAMLARARAAGVAQSLERFGFRLVTDTCWCMIEEPVIPPGPGSLLTNSGKYVHYGPGLTGRRVRFAGLAACVDAAATGSFDGTPPGWLLRAGTTPARGTDTDADAGR
jgi:predicted aconitase/predicted aconitase with swiveling domain